MNRVKYLDQMSYGKISRRDMLRGAGAFGVAVTLMPTLGRAAEPLTCMEWSGYDAPGYFDPFMKKHGSAPNFSIFAGEEDALAKVRAGFSADVMHPCNYSVGRFVEAGLTRPVDTTKLTNWNDVFEPLKTAAGVVENGDVVMVPADWGNSSIAYRPDLVGDYFKDGESWKIFFDDAYAGKVSMLDDPLAITIGAMVNGATYEQAYNNVGAELEAAKEMAQKTVNNSRFLWNNSTEVQQALASGEIVAAYGWNDINKNLSAQNIPVAYAKPKEGYFTWFCGLTLLNTGKADPKLSYDFIDAWLSPETGKLLIEGSGYGHANTKSFAASDPEAVKAMGITDPIEQMKNAILFKPQPNDVVVAQTAAWEELKALKL
jgi:spermidine/putrescine transport system substrate-binding protein